MISTKQHALIDYFLGSLMVLIPLFLYEENDSIYGNILMGCGAAMIIYNCMTRFEYSMYKFISVRSNKKLDIGIACILLGAAMLGMVRGEVLVLHLVFGIVQTGMIVFTANHRNYQSYEYKNKLNQTKHI